MAQRVVEIRKRGFIGLLLGSILPSVYFVDGIVPPTVASKGMGSINIVLPSDTGLTQADWQSGAVHVGFIPCNYFPTTGNIHFISAMVGQDNQVTLIFGNASDTATTETAEVEGILIITH
jgi:hypothetical protein